jgi:hypothetical protein
MNELSPNRTAVASQAARLIESGELTAPERDRQAGSHQLDQVADARTQGQPVMAAPGRIAGNWPPVGALIPVGHAALVTSGAGVIETSTPTRPTGSAGNARSAR